jgi:sporulation protein YlmC with PRC-barrel domain
MKRIFATASVLALLLAGPALAHSPAAKGGSSANTDANATTASGGAQPSDNAAVGSGSTTSPASSTTAIGPTADPFPAAADAKSLIGMDVYGSDGKRVGEISNLLVDSDGRVHAAVIAFGGFLGLGETKVAVPWGELNAANDRVTVNMSEDQIKAAPHWDKNEPGRLAEYQPLNK